MGFNIGKALHSLVGFNPLGTPSIGKQVARMGIPQQHPQGPSREQVANFNKNLVDVNQRAGTPLPVQQGSISPANPDGTWLRRNLGLPVNQSYHGDLGIQAVNQPQQGFGQQVQGVGGMPNDLQGLPGYRNTRQLQRPSFNPQVQDDGYYYY